MIVQRLLLAATLTRRLALHRQLLASLLLLLPHHHPQARQEPPRSPPDAGKLCSSSSPGDNHSSNHDNNGASNNNRRQTITATTLASYAAISLDHKYTPESSSLHSSSSGTIDVMSNAVNAVLRATRTSAEWESTLGISRRVSPVDFGWHGEIRLRFTDFQVYEIGRDGKVVHLQDTSVPGSKQKERAARKEDGGGARGEEGSHDADAKEEKEPEQKPEQKPEHQEQQPQDPQDAPAPAPQPEPEIPAIQGDTAPLAALAGDDFTQALVAMYDSLSSSSPSQSNPKTPILSDKPTRSQIHALVRTLFNSRIDTVTDADGAIAATLKSSRSSSQFHTNPEFRRRNNDNKKWGRDGSDNNEQQQQQRGEYLHFTLYKENRDTLDAVSHLSRVLRVRPTHIGTAGTKDRRAATAQRCSLRRVRADVLARTNGRVFGVVVGDFAYSAKPVHLGAHLGNEFVITVKQCKLLGENEKMTMGVRERVEVTRQRVEMALRNTARDGWINYFGHQRFGTHTTGTHEIGTLILKGDFAGAVAAILNHPPSTPIDDANDNDTTTMPASTRDAHDRNKACALFAADRHADAIAILPRRFAAETSVMRHLARPGCSRDYAGAFMSITRGLRTMYLHAYQSLVWNHAASRRWEMFGGRVVEGDLVVDHSTTSGGDGGAAAIVEQVGEDDQPIYDDVEEQHQQDNDPEATPTLRARALSAQEASSGKYTIADVVLPTPGIDVIYPTNELASFYETFMAETGNIDPHAMKRPQREFSLGGRYRALVGRFLAEPRCEVRAYARDDEQMFPTDGDKLREKRERNQGGGNKRARGQEEKAGEGCKKARVDGGDDVSGPGVDTTTTATEDVVKMDVDVDVGKKDDQGIQENQQQGEEESTEKKDVQEAQEVQETQEDAQDKVAVVVTFQLGKSAYATVVLRELMGDLGVAVEEKEE